MNTNPTTTSPRTNTTNEKPAECQQCGRVLHIGEGERVNLANRGEMPAFICPQCANGENDHALTDINHAQRGTATKTPTAYAVMLVFENVTPEARAEFASSGYQLASGSGYTVAKSPLMLSLKPYAKKLRTVEQLRDTGKVEFAATPSPVWASHEDITPEVLAHVNENRREVLGPVAEWTQRHREEAAALFGREVEQGEPLFTCDGASLCFGCVAFDSAAQYRTALNLAKRCAVIISKAQGHKPQAVGRQLLKAVQSAAAEAPQACKVKQLKA